MTSESRHSERAEQRSISDPKEGCEWVCWDCGQTYKTGAGALAHCEQYDHWLGEHRNGFRGNPATRTMHASGGVI